MENINKAQLSAALKKALSSEHLWSRDAAKFLNLNPVYISMMLNPKTFDKCGATAWIRLNEWFLTNLPISDFQFPEGEAVWQPKKQEPNIEGKGVETLPAGKKEKKEKKKKESAVKEIAVTEDKAEQPAEQPIGPTPEINVFLDERLCDAAADRIFKKWVDKGMIKDTIAALPVVSPSVENTTIRQSIALDIEINLIVNGQKVSIG
jgi:hypothetical protein